MAHLIFTDQPTADAFSAAIDADFGYPKANVVLPGGVAAPVGRTTRYAATLKHRTRSQWAYPEDPVVIGKEGRVPVPGGVTRQTLDGTWSDATPNARASELE